ncbi:MAG: DUF554 domain-containing protein [Lachnospiraceae bacterium]|nr:DUF554 domain-containing protein [Lachnospiraceae bacterium]
MLGTYVNAAAIIIGAAVGIAFKKGIPTRMADAMMKGLGLCVIFIGVSGSLKGENALILILSIVIGTIIGEAVNLEDKVNKLGHFFEKRFKKADNDAKDKSPSIAEGFVTASLLFCVGALAIVGSLQSGLTGNHEMIYSKSMIDSVSAAILASTLGAGVFFSAGLVLIYQGSITLLSQWIAPYLTDTVINEMTCVGSVILVGVALNMLGLTKLRVMNYVPAIFLPILLCIFM